MIARVFVKQPCEPHAVIKGVRVETDQYGEEAEAEWSFLTRFNKACETGDWPPEEIDGLVLYCGYPDLEANEQVLVYGPPMIVKAEEKE